VIPYRDGFAGISALLQEIASEGAASFLAVIKRMGPGRAGYLSFPLDGYTLAVDFPNNPGTAALYAKLARIVMDHGGRNYLAKDALLSRADFQHMYPERDSFREIAAQMDPDGRMGSDIGQRLGIRQMS
jgi:decaprenylphospho-beta-D-ribofuranose 2-oxidase